MGFWKKVLENENISKISQRVTPVNLEYARIKSDVHIHMFITISDLNAFTRSIDLISNIVAPIMMGQIMTYGSKVIAGIVIIIWHLVAITAEYILLRRVYFLVPELSKKKKGEALVKTSTPVQTPHPVTY